MLIGKYRSKFNKSFLFSVGSGIFILTPIFIWLTTSISSFESIRSHYKPSDVWIVDRNNYPLESIRTHQKSRSLDWTQWSEVSPAFQDLLIQAEDHRFFHHPGVDIIALAKASWDSLTTGYRRGASTLTMQLVGLIKNDSLNQRRSLFQKLIQIITALKVNSEWTKEQVLEAYINLVPFRGELVGLRAASLGYFGKKPSGLFQNEAALLVALLRSPNSSPELVAKRTCLLLKNQDCQEIQNLAFNILSRPYQITRLRSLIPVLSKHFIEPSQENASLVKTSLDYQIQELAIRTLKEQLITLKNQNMNDGAILILETQTGKVLSYVANSGAGFASAVQIDGIQTRRQVGSTIKPFVYATAFDWNLLTPTSLLEDSPADISVSHGRVYHPHNYDNIFRGYVSVGHALGSSINVPAVRALQLVGETRVLDRLRSLGFENLQSDEYYGPSLALGSIDLTLWELTQGYRKLAIDDSPFSKQTRQSIFNILAASEYRRFTFGIESILTLPFSAAVKTGTSKDMRDNWCIGWTPQYTIGVWVGNFNGNPMWNVSGVSGAAPIWRSLMLALHSNLLPAIKTQYEEPNAPLDKNTLSRIKYPAHEMLIGIDPDIPMDLQKLPIEIENPQHGQKLFFNHELLIQAQNTTLWSLKKGKHLVELKSSTGQTIDSVQFEVR